MVLANYIPSGQTYSPAELTSLQVAFDFLKAELGLRTEEERRSIARLVLAAYDQEGRQTHRIIAAVLRVCRSAAPNGSWETRTSSLAQTLSDLEDEMDADEAAQEAPPWKVPRRREPEGSAPT